MSALDDLTASRDDHLAADARWLHERDRLILQARTEHATWDQIRAAAGMSRAGVINAANVAAARLGGGSSKHEPR